MDQYIRHPRYENLFVIPYVQGRLVFAELAARAVSEGQFDQVLVDLPYFLNGMHDSLVPTRLFPLVSSLVIRNEKSRFISIPFVPNNAACSVVAASQLMSDHGRPIRLQFVDDSQVINYQEYLNHPEPQLGDDYLVFTDGLAGYLARPFHDLQIIWQRLPESNRFYLEYRASQVADRITRCLKGGQRTLFVCDYRLWHLVAENLESRKRSERNPLILPWTKLSAALIMEDPYQLWAMGLLDDFPVVVNQFNRHLKEGKLATFDKLEAVDTLITNQLFHCDEQPSPRKAVSFQRYLLTRLAADRHHVPLPVEHLYDAAHACAGRRFARALATAFLDYPADAALEKVCEYLTINKNKVALGGTHFDFPDLAGRLSLYGISRGKGRRDRYEDRQKIISSVRPYLTRRERAFLHSEKYSGVQWAIAPDYELHEIACERIRIAVDRRMRSDEHKSRRSWGSMGAGIHMKATIMSRARGEDAIHVKKRTPATRQHHDLDEATPIVFLFKDDLSGHTTRLVRDSNVTQRKLDLGNHDLISDDDPQPDSVYSLYATYNRTKVKCEKHIECNELSSIVFLYTRHMGVQRHAGITRRAEQFQCRIQPYQDPELATFTDTDLGTAWAIKYADESIILVAKDGWKPSTRIEGYARTKKVNIIVQSLTSLSSDLIQRMKYSHFISTPMKRHPHSDQIVERFLE